MSDSLQPHELHHARLPSLSITNIKTWKQHSVIAWNNSVIITKIHKCCFDVLHCLQILYHLSHQRSPRILEWVVYPFSRDLPDPGIEQGSLALHVDSWPAELPEKHHAQSINCVQLSCNPMVYSLPGSSVHGISQARILEWVVISFSRGSSWSREWTHVSCIYTQVLYHWVTKESQSLHSISLIFSTKF